MKDKIIQELTDKKILILGFGREGRSTYKFIKDNNINCSLGIADMNTITDKEILNNNISLHTGANYLDAMKDYDLIIKTPGISFKNLDLTGIRDKIISQTELFLKYGKNKIIGITGTKGKSTTSSLIYSMLKQKYNVLLVGNIGLPAFDEIENEEQIDYFVYELSSHQLEFVKHSPHIAVLLNMYEEHLDHYKGYEEYKEAKRNIFRYQNVQDYFIYNEQEKQTLINNIELQQNEVPVTKENCSVEEKYISLPGEHNKFNIAVAVSIAKLLDVPEKDIIYAISTFKPLSHRLESVGVYNDVEYIDDSIATIPQAVISAVRTIPNIDTVIIGGMDRGINYDMLIEEIKTGFTNNVILMYDSGKKIYEALKNSDNKNIYYVENLEEAVKLAVKVTRKNKKCLLSPAAASYGVFKNFEERGDKFKEYVIKYTSKG